jgi:hypothetical protein
MFIVRYDSFVKLIFSTFCPDLAHTTHSRRNIPPPLPKKKARDKSWIRFIDI